MGDLNALKSVWPTLTGTTADKLAALNAMIVAGPPQDITVASLQAFLAGNNLIAPLTAYAGRGPDAVQSALVGCNYLIAMLAASDPILHTSVPANFATVQQLGPALLADPATGVTPTHLAGMMALIVPQVSWLQANGFSGPVTVTDLIAAGHLF